MSIAHGSTANGLWAWWNASIKLRTTMPVRVAIIVKLARCLSSSCTWFSILPVAVPATASILAFHIRETSTGHYSETLDSLVCYD